MQRNLLVRLSMGIAVLLLGGCSTLADNSRSAEKIQVNQNVVLTSASEELTTAEAMKKLKWELGTMVAAISYKGVNSWDWGSSSFHTNNEDWFGMDTGSAGADKFGHMYSSYLINEFLNHRLNQKTDNKQQAAKKTALLSSGIMLGIEVLDGYSEDHGFAYEDLVFNTAGIGVSYLKNTVPGLDEKLDLRVEYLPTKENSDHPITDYSGYKYLSALKLSGFDRLKKTPLKYLELHLGYHTEGFKKNERKDFDEKKAEAYMGVGVNLSELIFNPLKQKMDSQAVDYADTFFHYYQMPGTYVATTVNERTAPLDK